MPQQTFRIRDPQSGRTVTLRGDSPPTEQELDEIFRSLGPAQQPRPGAGMAQPEPPSADDGWSLGGLASGALSMGRDLVTGLGKSAASTAVGLGELAHRIPGVRQGVQAVNEQLWGLTPEQQSASFGEARTALQPTNTTQKVGKVAGDIGQFFIPAGNVARGRAALSTGKGILDTLIGATLEGVAAGGVDAAQRGTVEGTGTTALTAGGMSAATSMLGRALRPLGARIEQALIKPTKADIADGFKVDNVFKHDLGGSLTQSYDKATNKLETLSQNLQAALRQPNASGATAQIDVLGALADVSKDLQASGARNFGQNRAIARAVDNLIDEPFFQAAAQSGKVDLVTANQIKQAVGDMGAWLHDPSGRVVVDPDSKALEKVANAVYRNLKLQIERSAAGPVGEINRQIAEIIPIRTAIVRRLPVEQRQNLINLGDMAGALSGQWGLTILNRILRSGQAANAMVGAAERAGTAGTLTGTLAGAGASQAQR